MPEPVLDDGTVLLRRWSVSDLACVRAVSEEGIVPETTTVPVSYSERAGRAWIDRQHQRTAGGEGWSLAITEVGPDGAMGRAVGAVVLLRRPSEGVAGVGYWLEPAARGRGLASRAVALVTGWALGAGGFARIEAWVEPGNTASAAVLARCGFEYEGRLRSYLSLPTRSHALVYSRIRAG